MLLPLVKGMHVHMNDKIFTAGSFGDEMYIIRNGEVKGMVPGVFISAGRQSENVESKNTLSTNKASFRLKSMMKRIKAMKKVQMRVSPKRDSTPEAGEKQQERETVGTGTLYHFTDGMLFGELVCCQCIPKRVYDAVAIVDTELYHINVRLGSSVLVTNHSLVNDSYNNNNKRFLRERNSLKHLNYQNTNTS